MSNRLTGTRRPKPARDGHVLTTVTLHPTKGYRRVSGARIEAQMEMQGAALRQRINKLGASYG